MYYLCRSLRSPNFLQNSNWWHQPPCVVMQCHRQVAVLSFCLTLPWQLYVTRRHQVVGSNDDDDNDDDNNNDDEDCLKIDVTKLAYCTGIIRGLEIYKSVQIPVLNKYQKINHNTSTQIQTSHNIQHTTHKTHTVILLVRYYLQKPRNEFFQGPGSPRRHGPRSIRQRLRPLLRIHITI